MCQLTLNGRMYRAMLVITVLHFNDSLQVILAAQFILRWHSNNTTTLRFQWKTCDLFFAQITWFCTPLWFWYVVWICRMISMKILFHVWNLILFKGQKYHQGSLAYFIFCIVPYCFLCDLWPDLWPVACNLTCDLWPVTWPVVCNLWPDLWPVTCTLASPLMNRSYG